MFFIFSRPSQFYLVLDVVNLTAQEMCLNYTSQKNILIEAKESCRVPVPVERCPIDRLLAAAEEAASAENMDNNCESEAKKFPKLFYWIFGVFCPSTVSILSGVDLPERVCSDHISSLVNLKWTLPATETEGVAKLRGISLSPTMLDLVTVAPLQWGECEGFW
jgi:trafficking protein particle complex subunit 9